MTEDQIPGGVGTSGTSGNQGETTSAFSAMSKGCNTGCGTALVLALVTCVVLTVLQVPFNAGELGNAFGGLGVLFAFIGAVVGLVRFLLRPRSQLDQGQQSRVGSRPVLAAMVILVSIVVVVLCCGIIKFGGDQWGADVAAELRENPRFLAHVGDVERIQIKWSKAGKARRLRKTPMDEVLIFDVQGSRGNGELTVWLGTNGKVREASLALRDGRGIDLIGH